MAMQNGYKVIKEKGVNPNTNSSGCDKLKPKIPTYNPINKGTPPKHKDDFQ